MNYVQSISNNDNNIIVKKLKVIKPPNISINDRYVLIIKNGRLRAWTTMSKE